MFEAKQTSLETYFKTQWEAGPDIEIEIAFENTEQPSEALFNEWVRFTCQFGSAKFSQIGGRGYRYFGVVMIQVFTKKGIGVNRGLELADAAALLFRAETVDGCLFDVPTIIKVPHLEPNWYQVQLSAPFYFNEVLG